MKNVLTAGALSANSPIFDFERSCYHDEYQFTYRGKDVWLNPPLMFIASVTSERRSTNLAVQVTVWLTPPNVRVVVLESPLSSESGKAF